MPTRWCFSSISSNAARTSARDRRLHDHDCGLPFADRCSWPRERLSAYAGTGLVSTPRGHVEERARDSAMVANTPLVSSLTSSASPTRIRIRMQSRIVGTPKGSGRELSRKSPFAVAGAVVTLPRWRSREEGEVSELHRDLASLPDLAHGHANTGPVRERRPVYVDLLPPCNAGCPAGENIQAWLSHTKAGRHEQAWRAARRGQSAAGDPRSGLLPPVRERLQPRRARQRRVDPLGRAVPGRPRAGGGLALRCSSGRAAAGGCS